MNKVELDMKILYIKQHLHFDREMLCRFCTGYLTTFLCSIYLRNYILLELK